MYFFQRKTQRFRVSFITAKTETLTFILTYSDLKTVKYEKRSFQKTYNLKFQTNTQKIDEFLLKLKLVKTVYWAGI